MPACPSTSDSDSTNRPVMRIRARKARWCGKAKQAPIPSATRMISGRKGIAGRCRRAATVPCSKLTVALISTKSHAPSEQTLRAQGQDEKHRDIERNRGHARHEVDRRRVGEAEQERGRERAGGGPHAAHRHHL